MAQATNSLRVYNGEYEKVTAGQNSNLQIGQLAYFCYNKPLPGPSSSNGLVTYSATDGIRQKYHIGVVVEISYSPYEKVMTISTFPMPSFYKDKDWVSKLPPNHFAFFMPMPHGNGAASPATLVKGSRDAITPYGFGTPVKADNFLDSRPSWIYGQVYHVTVKYSDKIQVAKPPVSLSTIEIARIMAWFKSLDSTILPKAAASVSDDYDDDDDDEWDDQGGTGVMERPTDDFFDILAILDFPPPFDNLKPLYASNNEGVEKWLSGV